MSNEKKEDPKRTETPPGPVTLSRQEYEDLQKRLQELEGGREQLLRSAADFDNAKKRLVRERDEFVKFGQENLIRGLLPVLDNFERALSHAEDAKDENFKKVAAGIRMVLKQLADILKAQGLKRLETLERKFDPHVHEAIGYVDGPGAEDHVVEEIEAGYFLHDKLLRAAKVRVRGSASASSRTTTSAPADEKPEELT